MSHNTIFGLKILFLIMSMGSFAYCVIKALNHPEIFKYKESRRLAFYAFAISGLAVLINCVFLWGFSDGSRID